MKIVQIRHFQSGTVATGVGTIPKDNSIPQSGEGDKYMELAIKPMAASNKLKIDVVFSGGQSAAGNCLIVALFQDDGADALAACVSSVDDNRQTSSMATCTFSYYMTAGTTSTTTFKVNAGGNGPATTTFNGINGAVLFGTAIKSSITITEYEG